MQARMRVFVVVGFAACTAAAPEQREAPVLVETPVVIEAPVLVETPVVVEAPVVAADGPAAVGCAWPAASGAVETAVASILAKLPTPDGFHCPRALHAVGTGERMVSYTGVDEATGDRVWVKLADHRGEFGERKASVFALPDAGGCHIDGLLDDEWYCMRAAARTAGGAQAVVAWLNEHPEVRALDWVYTGVMPGGRGPPVLGDATRALHVVDARGGTLCQAHGSGAQCWRQARPSRMNVGMFEIEVTAPGRRAWRPGAEDAAWPTVKEPDPLMATLSATFPDRVIRSVGDGVVVVGRYDEVGGQAAVGVEIVAQWLLLRGPSGWVSTPVPDVIVAEVVRSGPSVAVVGSTFFLGDGVSYERWDLLAFTPGTHGLELVGDLMLGRLYTDEDDDDDEDEGAFVSDARYRVTGRGAGCFRLKAPSRSERALAGDWQVTASGLRRGCG